MKAVTYNIQFIGITSAEIARERLLGIVKADREACPAWAWTFSGYRMRHKPALMHPSIPMVIKRALRWERRR